jgi:hypothetical protein
MRRWHNEKERRIMLRRWRAEIAAHETWGNDLPNGSYGRAGVHGYCLAPLPPDPDGDCHCYRGPGYFRKRTPFGCSCDLCKWDKHAWNRSREQRAALKREFEDSGLALHTA